jgi:hypothetical protein
MTVGRSPVTACSLRSVATGKCREARWFWQRLPPTRRAAGAVRSRGSTGTRRNVSGTMRVLLFRNPAAGTLNHAMEELRGVSEAVGLMPSYCATKGENFGVMSSRSADLVVAVGGHVAKVITVFRTPAAKLFVGSEWKDHYWGVALGQRRDRTRDCRRMGYTPHVPGPVSQWRPPAQLTPDQTHKSVGVPSARGPGAGLRRARWTCRLANVETSYDRQRSAGRSADNVGCGGGPPGKLIVVESQDVGVGVGAAGRYPGDGVLSNSSIPMLVSERPFCDGGGRRW